MKLTCPSCNAGLNIPDRLYGKKGKCPKCGNVIEIPSAAPEEVPELDLMESDVPQPQQQPTPNSDIVYCANCGNQLKATATFCTKCGTKTDPVCTQSPPQPYQQPIASSTAQGFAPSQQENPQGDIGAKKAKVKKSKKRKKLLIALEVVCLLIVLIIVISMITGGDGGSGLSSITNVANPNIKLVKNGTLPAFSNSATVGETFDTSPLIKNVTWESKEGERGGSFVEVRGDVIYDMMDGPDWAKSEMGDKCTLVIQFPIGTDGTTFELGYIGVEIWRGEKMEDKSLPGPDLISIIYSLSNDTFDTKFNYGMCS